MAAPGQVLPPVAVVLNGLPPDTRTLCGSIINPSYQEAHNRVVHLAGYEPLQAEPASAGVETCKLCGAIVNQSYQEAHDRTHA